MPNNFLIYAYPRTGSYHLTSLLDSASDVVCHGEVFKQKSIELRSWHRRRIAFNTPEERDAAPEMFIRSLRTLNPHKHFGFKVFRDHIKRVPWLYDPLRSSEWRQIALVRDPIEVYASLQRARETKVWTLPNTINVSAKKLEMPVRFSLDTWMQFCRSYEGFLRESQKLGHPVFIKYDQLADQEALSRVLEHIGSDVNASALKSSFRKQYRKPISEAFENWDELQAQLDDHPAPELPGARTV